jgi:hypothetical protein
VWIVAGGVVALLLYLLVYSPLYARYLETLAGIESAQMKLERSQRLVQQEGSLDRQIKQLEAALKILDSSVFQGETTSLVGAEMQEIMNGICSKNGANIRQTRVLKVTETGPYKEISISVDMTSSLSALSKIMFDLTHNSYLFLISEVSTRSSGRGAANNMRTRLTISGFMQTAQAGK